MWLLCMMASAPYVYRSAPRNCMPDGPWTAYGSSDGGACDLGYWPATAVSPGLGGPPGAQKRAMFCSRFSICALDRTNSCRQNSYTCIRQHTSASQSARLTDRTNSCGHNSYTCRSTVERDASGSEHIRHWSLLLRLPAALPCTNAEIQECKK